MLIRAVDTIPVRVQRATPFKSSLGSHMSSTAAIVRVDTDTGLRGVGEISMIWNGGGAWLCAAVRDLLGPAIIGMSPFDINQALKRMDDAVQFSLAANPAKAAVEMALYDILGKAWNTPVYNILGGEVRNQIVLSMSIPMDSIEKMVERAREIIAQGFRGVKIKVGLDRRHDVKAVRAIREAVGEDVTIRVDANMGWHSPREACSVIQELARLRIHSVEQPLPRERIHDLALIRAQSPVPIMLDESVWSVDDAQRVIEAKAADILNVYVSEAGGLTNAMRIFGMAEAAGVQCTIGSMPELGIGTAAQAHLGVAVPELCEPADVCGFLYFAESLIKEKWDVEGGRITPPKGPGLGVTVDDERLAMLAM